MPIGNPGPVEKSNLPSKWNPLGRCCNPTQFWRMINRLRGCQRESFGGQSLNPVCCVHFHLLFADWMFVFLARNSIHYWKRLWFEFVWLVDDIIENTWKEMVYRPIKQEKTVGKSYHDVLLIGRCKYTWFKKSFENTAVFCLCMSQFFTCHTNGCCWLSSIRWRIAFLHHLFLPESSVNMIFWLCKSLTN